MKRMLCIMLLAVTIISCKEEPAPQQMGVKSYPVVEVVRKSLTGYQAFPASIEGTNNNEVRAKISGYIQKLYVDEGQKVKAGQVICRLETNTLSQNADAAKSGVSAAQAMIETAESNINTAQIEVDRLTPLVEKGIIGSVQLETAKAKLLQAQSGLSQAQANHKQSQANLNSVQANINYAVIKAPISGTVGSISMREGTLVSPSDPSPITTISKTDDVYAYFSMNESDYFDFLESMEGTTINEKIKNIPPVDLELANGSIYEEKGEIKAVTGQIDPSTGTIQFRANFNNEKGLLSNGNSGTVRIPNDYKNVMVVPESATVESQGITQVYKVVNDTVKLQVVEVGDRIDNFLIVNNGLKEKDIIVAQGLSGLRRGTAIKPNKISVDSLVNSIKPIFK